MQKCIHPDTPWTPHRLTLEPMFYIMSSYKMAIIMSNTFLLPRQNQNQLPLYLRRKDIRSSLLRGTNTVKLQRRLSPMGGFESELNRILIFTTLSAINCTLNSFTSPKSIGVLSFEMDLGEVAIAGGGR